MKTKLKILEVCKEKGMTLTELASRIPSKRKQGGSIAVSSLFSSIKNENMTLSSLETIADALGVSVFDLIERTDEIVPDVPQTKTSVKCPKCGEEIEITLK